MVVKCYEILIPYLGVVDIELGTIPNEPLAHVDCGRLPGVTRVLQQPIICQTQRSIHRLMHTANKECRSPLPKHRLFPDVLLAVQRNYIVWNLAGCES